MLSATTACKDLVVPSVLKPDRHHCAKSSVNVRPCITASKHKTSQPLKPSTSLSAQSRAPGSADGAPAKGPPRRARPNSLAQRLRLLCMTCVHVIGRIWACCGASLVFNSLSLLSAPSLCLSLCLSVYLSTYILFCRSRYVHMYMYRA